MEDNYEDIINNPHYEPKNHPRMSAYNRASQFAPFAALTGYNDLVSETSRLTDLKIEDNEELNNDINNKLQILENYIKDTPQVTITYFVKDQKKSGGTYKEITSNIKKIDSINKILIMTNNKKIKMEDILSISSDILKKYENTYNN